MHVICFLTGPKFRPAHTRQVVEHHTDPNTWGTEEVPLMVWHDDGTPSDEYELLFDLFQDVSVQFRSSSNRGIAHSINRCLQFGFEYGAELVTILGNDIIEPQDWLYERQMIYYETGCAVSSVPPLNHHRGCVRYKRRETLSGRAYEVGQVIGNFTVSRQCWQTVGRMCEDYDPYGPIDLDYCDRIARSGLTSCYLSDLSCDDIGNDSGKLFPEYEKTKTDSLARTWPIYLKNLNDYNNGKRLKQ